MRSLFHILGSDEWNLSRRQTHYSPKSLVSEGFIHMSRAHQVVAVLERLFQGQQDLVLLHVDQDLVEPTVKEEASGGDKFPHVYGPLNISSVASAVDLTTGPDGAFKIQLTLVDDVLIRPGRLGDAAEIASVHVHSWQQSYRGQMLDDILDSLPLGFAKRLRWWKSVVDGRTATQVFVAESHLHGIVGFCAVEPARDLEFSGFGEITAIYCLNEFKGKGVGKSLFRMGQAALVQQGLHKQYLWVLKDNPTIAFYQRMGGVQRAEQKTVKLGKPLTEIAFEFGG